MPRHAEWKAELPATLEAVDRFCIEFRSWRDAACGEIDGFTVELMLRELLNNAVVHGCSFNPDKRVACHLRAKPGRLVISIRDEGEGFDWAGRGDCESALESPNGRGLEIIKQFSHSFRFNRKGNSITLIKRFTGSTNRNPAMNSNEMTEVAVRPDADLVASKVPELRSKLRGLVESGAQLVTLDLAGVRMVDSTGIGLLISLHNSLKKSGGRVDVINASKDILALFRTMRIHQHMAVSGE